MAEKPDPELDELLDSAAKDFKKPEASSSNFDPSHFLNPDGSMNIEKWKKFQEEQKVVSDALLKQAEEEFSASDLAKELNQKLQESLAAAAEEQGLTPEEVSNRLSNLNLFGGGGPAMDADKEKEFSDAIMGAMQSMRENLSEAFPTEREGEDGDGEDASGNEMDNLANVMQQIMLSVLSKELLLPSFKEMSENYPAWLLENKSKLPEEEFARYTAQLEVVLQIVAQLEKEGSEDDKEHLERMVELMGKAQELGQPPADLTAQLSNAIDETKMEAMMKASATDQCNIM